MAEAIFKFILITLFIYRIAACVNTRYYPCYHFAPEYGWMNDPNGFSLFRNEYHLFYQYNPYTSEEPGIANWGHAVSNDLVNWKHLPIAMKPDKSYDKTGVFSGSAIAMNDTLYLIYTGNVKYPDETPDHKQVQALAYTKDGVNVHKYEGNPIIDGNKFQPDFRDPKVWKYKNDFYMVLGNSIENTTGQVLLYQSKNLVDWTYKSVLLKSNGSLGYMWECPDFFKLNGKYVLLFSPQGIAPQGDKYKNLYQTGYIVGSFDYKSKVFRPESEFVQMDDGHDFYATQTMLDKEGRRIMIAWFDMWEQVYPERADCWAGLMTVPRQLSINSKGRIVQKPIRELDELLGKIIHSGPAAKGHHVGLPNKSGKVTILASTKKDFCLHVRDASNSTNEVLICYNHKEQRVSLDRGGSDGSRRTHWSPIKELKWTIYIDRSSIELFCADGEVTLSSRFFAKNGTVLILGGNARSFLVQEMKCSISQPRSGYCNKH